jgi:3-methyladenine DNA glycosylase AlkC
LIKDMAGHFHKHCPELDQAGFIKDANKDFDSLELKQRSNRITEVMIKYLPSDFEESGRIILLSLGKNLDDDLASGKADSSGIAGWAIMPLEHYVAQQGHDHFDLSMNLFKEMTKRGTAEFGIRYFLEKWPVEALAIMKEWTADENVHVRRLASEGSRPKLPWGIHLPVFIKDPAPVVELLTQLKDDDKEYVRRSVANNLNDIAKDHPDLVASIAKQWMVDASKDRKRLIKHACRTLLKNGHPDALEVLGFTAPVIKEASIEVLTPEVVLGESLEFSLALHSDAGHEQAVMVDFIIHHQKANGTTTPKVFKWKTAVLPADKPLMISKRHGIKKITTRVYYPGLHGLEVIVNGVSVGRKDFHLMIP